MHINKAIEHGSPNVWIWNQLYRSSWTLLLSAFNSHIQPSHREQAIVQVTNVILYNQQLADELNEFNCRFEKTTFTPPATPPPPSPTPALQIREDDVQKEQKKESTRPRRCVTSLPKYLSWPAGPHLHTDLQQITGAVGSPLMLQMLHHHPRPKETQNYWT